MSSSSSSLEDGRLVHARAHEERGAGHDRPDEERDAPAPRVEVRAGDERRREGGETDSHETADLTGRRGQRRDESATLRLRTFDEVGDDAGVLTADAEGHEAAHRHHEPARRSTDRRVGRQQCGDEHRDRHERHRDEQNRLAPDPVADVTEHRRADRAQQVGECEHEQRGGGAAGAAPEEDAGDHRRHVEIQREVVPLDDGRHAGHRERTTADGRVIVQPTGWCVGDGGHRIPLVLSASSARGSRAVRFFGRARWTDWSACSLGMCAVRCPAYGHTRMGRRRLRFTRPGRPGRERRHTGVCLYSA